MEWQVYSYQYNLNRFQFKVLFLFPPVLSFVPGYRRSNRTQATFSNFSLFLSS